MTDPSGILTSFSGTLLALSTAGVLWLFKAAYQTYQKERLAIVKIERSFVLNLRYLKDNFDLLGIREKEKLLKEKEIKGL